eukprot:343988_1
MEALSRIAIHLFPSCRVPVAMDKLFQTHFDAFAMKGEIAKVTTLPKEFLEIPEISDIVSTLHKRTVSLFIEWSSLEQWQRFEDVITLKALNCAQVVKMLEC